MGVEKKKLEVIEKEGQDACKNEAAANTTRKATRQDMPNGKTIKTRERINY